MEKMWVKNLSLAPSRPIPSPSSKIPSASPFPSSAISPPTSVSPPHPSFPSLLALFLTPAALLLDHLESPALAASLPNAANHLARLLVMSHSSILPLSFLLPLCYDLCLSLNFRSSLTSACPNLFYSCHPHDGVPLLSLAKGALVVTNEGGDEVKAGGGPLVGECELERGRRRKRRRAREWGEGRMPNRRAGDGGADHNGVEGDRKVELNNHSKKK